MKFGILFFLIFVIFKRFSSSPIEKNHFDIYNDTVIKLESSLNTRMPQVDDYLTKVNHNLKKQKEAADDNSLIMPKSTENKEYINETLNLSNTTDYHENDLGKMKTNENSFHHKQMEIFNNTVTTDGSPSLTKKNWGNELIFDNESHMLNSSQKEIFDNDGKDAASKVEVLNLRSEKIGQKFSQENISISNKVAAEGKTLGNDLSRNFKKLELKESNKNEENSKDEQTINRDQSIVTTTSKAVYSNLNSNSPKLTNTPNVIKKISKKYQNLNKEIELTSVIGIMNQNGFKTKRSKKSEVAGKKSNEGKSYSKTSPTTANTEKNSNQGKTYSMITSTAANIDLTSQQKMKTSEERERKIMKNHPKQNGSSFLKNIKIYRDNELIFDNKSMINSSQKETLVNYMKDAASKVEILDLNIEKVGQQFNQENKNISSNVTAEGKNLRNGLSQIRNLEKIELKESNTNEENSTDDQKINREQSIVSTTSKAIPSNLNSNNPKINNAWNLINKFSKKYQNVNKEIKSTSVTAFENQSGFKIKRSEEFEVTEKKSNEGKSHSTTTPMIASAKESSKQGETHSKTTPMTAGAKENSKQGETHSKTTPMTAGAKENSKQGETHSKTTPMTAGAKENSKQGETHSKTTPMTAGAKENSKQGEKHSKTTPTTANSKESSKQVESHNKITPMTANAKESAKQGKSHSKNTPMTVNSQENPTQGETYSRTTPITANTKESSKQGESHSKATPITANAKESSKRKSHTKITPTTANAKKSLKQGKLYHKTTSMPTITDHSRQQEGNTSKERVEILTKNKYDEKDVTTGNLKFSATTTESNNFGETDPSHGNLPKNGQSKILVPTEHVLSNNKNNQELQVKKMSFQDLFSPLSRS